MAYNYKRGKDSSGNDLPNHFFFDLTAPTNGSGSSSSPFNAINNANMGIVASAGFIGDGLITTIVLPPNRYLNLFDTLTPVGFDRILRILGDSENFDVVIETSTSGRPNFHAFYGTNSGTFGVQAKNIVLKNYTTSRFLPQSCILDNCYTGSWGVGIAPDFPSGNCIYVNSELYSPNSNVEVTMTDAVLYNCLIRHNNSGTVSRAYIDSTCVITTGVGSITYNSCFFEDFTVYSTSFPTLTVNQTNPIITPSLLNAPDFWDFSTSSRNSPLITNNIGGVGRFFKGISFNTGLTAIQNLINAVPELEIVNGNIQVKASAPSGTYYTSALVFDVPLKNILSKTYQIGLGYNPEITFQVRWKFNDTDPNFTDWKDFRFGENMRQNTDGKTTGEAGYNWLDENVIPYSIAEGRFKIVKP